MKTLLKSALVGVMMFSASSVQADPWVAFNNLIALHSYGTDEIHFKTDASDPDSPCTWAHAWSLKRTHPHFKEIYSMMLIAQAQGSSGRVSGTRECDIDGGHKQYVKNFLLGPW